MPTGASQSAFLAVCVPTLLADLLSFFFWAVPISSRGCCCLATSSFWSRLEWWCFLHSLWVELLPFPFLVVVFVLPLVGLWCGPPPRWRCCLRLILWGGAAVSSLFPFLSGCISLLIELWGGAARRREEGREGGRRWENCPNTEREAGITTKRRSWPISTTFRKKHGEGEQHHRKGGRRRHHRQERKAAPHQRRREKQHQPK